MIGTALGAQLAHLVAGTPPEDMPARIVSWFGAHAIPNGDEHTRELSASEWQLLYARLRSDALADDLVSDPAEVPRVAGTDAPMPIVVAHFRYARPRVAFENDVREAARAGKGLAKDPTHADALEPAVAFFAAALLPDQWGRHEPAHHGRTIRFTITDAGFLTEDGARPDRMELDPGDGDGFRPLALDETLETTIPEGDVARVRVRCQFGDVSRTACFRLPLTDSPAPPPPDDSWSLDGGEGVTGHTYVYRAEGHADVVHPLLLAEGFPGGYPAAYLYDLLNQQGTLESLRAAGYDIVFVGFDQGTRRMEENARVLEAAIAEVRRRTDQPLVVAGVSMGGLIARYALASLERRGEPHGARVLLTIDAPHGGAYTAVANQWLAHGFARYSHDLAGLAWLLDTPANQQFLTRWLHDGAAGPSPLRAEWLNALAAVGEWPKDVRRLAIACGAGDGARDGEPGESLLSWQGSAFVGAALHALPDGGCGIVAEGHRWWDGASEALRLEVESDRSWETAPGGRNEYTALAGRALSALGCGTVAVPRPRVCSVPTVSALALDIDPFEPVPPPAAGLSPFHDYVCSSANELHLTLTPETSAWLLRSLGPPIPARSAE